MIVSSCQQLGSNREYLLLVLLISCLIFLQCNKGISYLTYIRFSSMLIHYFRELQNHVIHPSAKLCKIVASPFQYIHRLWQAWQLWLSSKFSSGFMPIEPADNKAGISERACSSAKETLPQSRYFSHTLGDRPDD